MTTTNSPEAQPQGVDLLPCPFCPHGYGFLRNESGRYNGVVWVECDWPSNAVRLVASKDVAPPCGAKTAEYQTEEEAAKAWNTRADLPRATADAAHLRQVEALRTGAVFLERLNTKEALEVAAYLRNEMALPRATGETESALAELREMFPHNELSVQLVSSSPMDQWWQITVGNNTYYGSQRNAHPLLSDCVAQVRAAAQTKAESGDK